MEYEAPSSWGVVDNNNGCFCSPDSSDLFSCWAVFLTILVCICYLTVTLPDGVYSVAKVNEVMRGHFEANGLPPASIAFYPTVQGDSVVVDILQPGFLLDLAASTIAPFLGFSGGTLPDTGRFTEPTTLVSSSLQGAPYPLILATNITRHADLAGEYIIKAAAGSRHSIVQTYNIINRLTRVWAFGSNRHGQLGCEFNAYTDEGSGVPCLVHSTGVFDSALVQDMAAGDRHSALLDQAGRVFLFGSDSHGQLGTGTAFNRSHAANFAPRLLTSLGEESARYSMIFLGYDHTIVFGNLKNRSSPSWSAGMKAWGFGSNEHGQLGSAGSQLTAHSNPIPRRIATPGNDTWVTGCAGNFHTLLLDDDNKLWATGHNSYGQAGVLGKPTMIASTAQMYKVGSDLNYAREIIGELESFTSQDVTTFACGGDHNLVLTGSGKLWSFGINDLGQLAREENLGNANANEVREVPNTQFIADGLDPQPITGIWAAGENSIFQTAKQPCFPTYFSYDGLQPCYPCQAGTYSNERGAMSCIACSLGYYTPLGMTQCFKCDRGSYSDRVGQDACTACPPSQSFTKQKGSISIRNCTLPCEPGTEGPLGAGPCTVCAPGTFSLKESSRCSDCPRGTYQERNGSSSCQLCPQGQSTADESSADGYLCREICSPGFFGAAGLAESEIVNGSEVRACLPCAIGHFSASSRMEVCEPCDFHSYMEVTGRSTCDQCPAGHGTEARGSTNASLCIPFCRAGTVSATSVEPCGLCGAGLYAPQSGLTQCLQCAAGTYSAPTTTYVSKHDPSLSYSLQWEANADMSLSYVTSYASSVDSSLSYPRTYTAIHNASISYAHHWEVTYNDSMSHIDEWHSLHDESNPRCSAINCRLSLCFSRPFFEPHLLPMCSQVP